MVCVSRLGAGSGLIWPATIRGLTRSIDLPQVQQRHFYSCNINSFTLLLSDRYNVPENSHQRKVCCAHSKTSICSLCFESSLAAALYQEFGRRSLLILFFCTLVTKILNEMMAHCRYGREEIHRRCLAADSTPTTTDSSGRERLSRTPACHT